MKLYKSDKVRFFIGLILIIIVYSCYHIFIAEQKNTTLIPRKLRHVITLLVTLLVYFIGTQHLGKLKIKWMVSLWHLIHISGLLILIVLGVFDWLFLNGEINRKLSSFASTIQELLISPILYVGMGLINNALNNKSLAIN